MSKELLTPSSIAIIGASRSPGKVGYEVLANLKNAGFEGALIPINPSASEILDLPCYPSLKDYGEHIDMSIVVVPASMSKDAVRTSINAGAKAIVVITAGFKEVDANGVALEKEIAALCRNHKVRLMGPNCIGIINTHHKMNATFAPQMPKPGGISVISQSGALCVAILDLARSLGLGLGKVISMGNKADLSEVDFLSMLAQDEDTKVIAGYLESIDEGDHFLRVAEMAASEKPVVILKVGVSAAGARAASSHTGSLAGADMAYGAAFKRSGVIRAENFEALFDYTSAFAMQPLPSGCRIAVLTNAGGPGIMAADAIESAGLEMATLSPKTMDRLRACLPDSAAVGNPVDVIGDANPDRYLAAFDVLQDDPDVDAFLVVATPQNMTAPVELAERISEAHRVKKPLVTAFLGGTEMQPAWKRLAHLGIPNFLSPGRAVNTLRAMCEYAAWRQRPQRIVTRFPVNRRRVDRVLNWHKKMGITQMGEVEAKEILRAYDFNILAGSLVDSAEAAIEAAERIGYPVVMKIASPDIIHKSDFGGVRIDLSNAEQVLDAYDLMMLRTRRRAPEAYLRGVYIEKMGPRGREVILGMTRDPQFGPMLMFGLGGIFVEVMKDVTFHLAPITSSEAMQMLEQTRSYALLKGARGQAPVDLEAIAEGLQRISQLATDYPQVMEVDMNPFIVGPVGTEAYVADARMTLG